MNLKQHTITAINGVKVGHSGNSVGKTGCSAVLFPECSTCAFEQRGGASCTRETDIFMPGKLVDCVDALVFSGGSSFGLAAADGAIKYLLEQNRGIKTAGGLVPIVPAASIYDLLIGKSEIYPDAKMGYQACQNANSRPVESGSIGAGTGASINKHLGSISAKKGGIGNAGLSLTPEIKVAVMLVVNSFGDVVQDLKQTDQSANSNLLAPEESILFSESQERIPMQNTVLGVVVTNAHLSRDELIIVARMAQSGLCRAIVPSHTPFDGDTIFAVSTGTKPYDAFSIATLAQRLAQEAVYDAVENSK